MREILETSSLTKASLSSRAGVSRALLDAYLSGATQPSVAQVEKLAQAAGLTLDVTVRSKPVVRPVPEAFLAVLDFGANFPPKRFRPLVNLGPVWAQAAERSHA